MAGKKGGGTRVRNAVNGRFAEVCGKEEPEDHGDGADQVVTHVAVSGEDAPLHSSLDQLPSSPSTLGCSLASRRSLRCSRSDGPSAGRVR